LTSNRPIIKNMIALLSLIGAIALGPLALRYGVEQRPGFAENPRSL
jgi:hypothetical protein